MRKAVCLLYQYQNENAPGQIPAPPVESLSKPYYLVVSRRNSESSWGLPGGKVDPGETSIDAIIREVEEETGLVFSAARP